MSAADLDLDLVRERAVLGAKWYANTQVIGGKPYWDANHGRYVYTYHIPTKDRVLGLSWTQGRGNFAVFACYELTGDEDLLTTARRATEYVKVLQILDQREPRLFGVIREESPNAVHMYPRDAMEAGLGLLFQYRLTGERDCLERAELFARCLMEHYLDDEGWIVGDVSLHPDYEPRRRHKHISCIGGGVNLFYYLAKATGNDEYIERAFNPMAHCLMREFVDEQGIHVSHAARHHTGPGAGEGKVPLLNDDGNGITHITAARLLDNQEYLDRAVNYGDWLMAQDYPTPIYSAVPIRMLTLVELSEATGDGKYRDFAAGLVPTLLEWQVVGSDDPAVEGAFRGEDEGGPAYGHPEATPLDFVCNRMTSYSVLALLKVTGDVVGPYYSGLNWETPRQPVPPTGGLPPVVAF